MASAEALTNPEQADPHHAMSWSDVERACGELVTEIKATNPALDTIIAVAKGGVIPASLVWQVFPDLQFKIVRISSYTREGKKKPKIQDIHKLAYYNSPKTLVIDDICDSGDTFRALKKYLPDARYSAMLLRAQCTFHVDFIGMSIAKNVWVDFPWKRRQDDGESPLPF